MLDRSKIRNVGGKVEEAYPDSLDGLLDAETLWTHRLVEDHGVAALQNRDERAGNTGEEPWKRPQAATVFRRENVARTGCREAVKAAAKKPHFRTRWSEAARWRGSQPVPGSGAIPRISILSGSDIALSQPACRLH